MQRSQRKRQEILRAFHGLIVVVVVSVTLVASSVLIWQARERALRERLEQFHIRSIMLTFEASRQTSVLELELAALNHTASGAFDPGLSSNRAIQTPVQSIGQLMDSIVALSGEWRQPADPVAGTLTRATRQYRDLRDAMSGGSPTMTDLSSTVGALEFTLFQLDRLHVIAAQKLLDQIEVTGRRNTRRTAQLSGFVLLVAGLIVARILLLLRARLSEHERTEKKLLERERLLRQSAKMEALGSLVGGVAHDFNNLLTVVLGHTEILLNRMNQTDPGRDTLSEIRKAGERAADLTRQLLVFSRQQVAEPRVLDLNLVIRELEPILRRLIREDVTLEFDLESGIGNVEIDPVQIEQVLVNLAINARDAMEDGGVLTVRTCHVTSDAAGSPFTGSGDYVQVRMEDTGCGMPPETLSRAFDPFFTTKEQGKGTGLGLATVDGIVTKAGGHMRVQSEVGAGTRFEVNLPRCDKPAIEHVADAERGAAPGGSETVLVAEDEPEIRELVVSTLRGAGYQLLEAGDGNEALRVCVEHPGPVHLILSDVIMPGMRGPEMVRQALQFQPCARVLYVSGYSDDEVLKGGSLSDAPLLTKPFKLQELLKLVRRELDAAGIQEGVASSLAGMAPEGLGVSSPLASASSDKA